ncbi:MAG: type II toxin-antitoxin system VapC family toxin [Candidatus Nitrosotenuis sp.]
MVCLDTDFLIAYLRNNSEAKTKLEELALREEPLYTTTINAFELYKGAKNSNETSKVEKLLDVFYMLVMDRESAKMAGAIHNRSHSIGEADLMIACITISNKQALLTRNKKHFAQISGLKIEGW